MTKFEKECSRYSIDDLELIVKTQQDLYTDEEMKCLIETLEKKKQAAEIERIKSLPTKMKCPKCDVVIPIKSEKCPYCEFEFGKNKYQYAISNDCDEYLSATEETEESRTNISAYIFSFIIPIVGFILGAILMSKDNEDEKSQGITCIILGIISAVVSSIVLFISIK